MRRRQGGGDERGHERRACHLPASFFSASSLYDITGGGGGKTEEFVSIEDVLHIKGR